MWFVCGLVGFCVGCVCDYRSGVCGGIGVVRVSRYV